MECSSCPSRWAVCSVSCLPTQVRTFVEVGSFFGWTGLFFTAYMRRLFESSSWAPVARPRRVERARQDFRSSSFDVVDMRTMCVKDLMAKYKHDFHVNRGGGAPLKKLENGTRIRNRPLLAEDHVAAVAWYDQRLAESFGSIASPSIESVVWRRVDPHNRASSKIDLCFIDAAHGFPHVVEDVRYFQPLCRFLLFHDIVDADSVGVRTVWKFLSGWLLREREQRTKELNPVPNSTLWEVNEGFYRRECIQQAGTNRRNFGLGIISAQHINSSWLDRPVRQRQASRLTTL